MLWRDGTILLVHFDIGLFYFVNFELCTSEALSLWDRQNFTALLLPF